MVIISYVLDAGKDISSLSLKAFSRGEKTFVKAGIILSIFVFFFKKKFTDCVLFMNVVSVAENNKDVNHEPLVTGLYQGYLNLQRWELLLMTCETKCGSGATLIKGST